MKKIILNCAVVIAAMVQTSVLASPMEAGERVIYSPIETKKIEDASVGLSEPNRNYGLETILKIGGRNVWKTYLKFQLPDLTTADSIVSAKLELSRINNNQEVPKIHLFKIEEDWNSSSITWDSQPYYDEGKECLCSINQEQTGALSLDITDLVTDWYRNGKNNGIVLANESGLNGQLDIYSSDCSLMFKEERPRLVITYENQSGIERKWRYSVKELEGAGKSYINCSNGNLIFVHDTMELINGQVIKHIYNSGDKNINIGYGWGWRINYHQEIKKIINGCNICWEYTDEDGTRHLFYYDGDGIWKDTLNKERQLYISENLNERYIMLDLESDIKRIFNKDGNLITVVEKDETSISITYKDEKINNITDAYGNSIKFIYNPSGYLYAVEDFTEHEKRFNYTGGCLSSIKFNGNIIDLLYDENKCPLVIRNAADEAIHYSYSLSNISRAEKHFKGL